MTGHFTEESVSFHTFPGKVFANVVGIYASSESECVNSVLLVVKKGGCCFGSVCEFCTSIVPSTRETIFFLLLERYSKILLDDAMPNISQNHKGPKLT